jgi:hypothetical protein
MRYGVVVLVLAVGVGVFFLLGGPHELIYANTNTSGNRWDLTWDIVGAVVSAVVAFVILGRATAGRR